MITSTTHLPLSDGPQRLDDGELRLEIRRAIQETHHRLHHLGCGLLQLTMFLREQQHLLVEKTPVAGILGY